MNLAALEPHRHDPPHGWDVERFAVLTDALAEVLVAAWRRVQANDVATPERARRERERRGR